MIDDITRDKADILSAMEQQLQDELLKKEPEKLWDNSFIKHQIDKRKNGGQFSMTDHIRAMVYSMLSSGISWNRVEKNIPYETPNGYTGYPKGIHPDTKYMTSIDDIFCGYDIKQLLSHTPEQLRDAVKSINCGTQSTLKQMNALLSSNIPKLLTLEKEHGTVDTYYQRFIAIDGTLKTLITTLATVGSKDKMVQMDIALVCEYLRNVGYDIPKPDRHICRILGHDYLAFSSKSAVPPFEAFDIILKLAEMTGKSAAEVDHILWSYCADGYGEICTKKMPKCGICVVNEHCGNAKN